MPRIYTARFDTGREFKFKVGDKIVVTSRRYEDCYHIYNKKGIIKTISLLRTNNYGIEFETNICGHNIDDFGKGSYCLWVEEDMITLAENIKPKVYGIVKFMESINKRGGV